MWLGSTRYLGRWIASISTGSALPEHLSISSWPVFELSRDSENKQNEILMICLLISMMLCEKGLFSDIVLSYLWFTWMHDIWIQYISMYNHDVFWLRWKSCLYDFKWLMIMMRCWWIWLCVSWWLLLFLLLSSVPLPRSPSSSCSSTSFRFHPHYYHPD